MFKAFLTPEEVLLVLDDIDFLNRLRELTATPPKGIEGDEVLGGEDITPEDE